MKLSKVLSLVLAIAMLLSVPTFAAFTDVAADANYAEAVTVLSALDIINGYEDGSFKPEGKITRAEYAAIVCRVNNMDDAAKANATGGIFTDVAADHWASGYIATAYQAGIINGMGDGTFAPEAEVTYEQAVKMLVAALGYEMKAQSMGGYPTGYMMIANQESITVGTTNTAGGASRATVARLTYNALTVPMMDQTAWGTDVEFKPIKTQSLLFTKLNAVKAEVTFNNITNLLDKTATDVTVAYANNKLDPVAYANLPSSQLGGNLVPQYNLKINGVDLTGLQGLTATVIIDKSDDSAWKLICVVPKAGKNVEIVVDPALLQEVDYTDGYIDYKKTADDDRASKIKVTDPNNAVAPITYKNLQLGTFGSVTGTNPITYAGDVIPGGNTGDVAYRFVDTNNDGTYETVFVDNIGLFVVGSVNEKAYKIYRDTSSSNAMYTYAGGSFITLDPENDSIDWSLTDEAGNAIELADIEAGSVLAVATSTQGSNTYYDIVVSKNVIEGTVAQIYTDNGKTYYTIGDADYTMLTSNSVNAGEVITATVYGDKIVNFSVAEGVRNYGVVIATYKATDFTTTYQVQLLTQKGEITTLNFAEKVNGSTFTGGSLDFDNNSTYAEKDLIISYSLNAAGEIKAYDIESTNGSTSEQEFATAYARGTDKLAANAGATGYGVYRSSAEKLDSFYITDNTTVVLTKQGKGSNTKTDLIVADKSALDDTETYSNYTVVYDDNKEAKLVVLFQKAGQVNMNAFPIAVTKKSTVSVDNEMRYKYFGYVNGEEVELIEDEDRTNSTGLLNVNDIAMYTVNAAGEIANVVKLATYGANGYTVVDNTALAKDDEKESKNGTDYEIKFAPTTTGGASLANLATFFSTTSSTVALKGFGAVGKAYSVKGKTLNLVNPANYATSYTAASGSTPASRNYGTNEANVKDYSINSAAVAYVYDAVNSKLKVATIGDLETEVNTNDYNVATQLENDDAVYVYNYDGDTKLILIVDTKN